MATYLGAEWKDDIRWERSVFKEQREIFSAAHGSVRGMEIKRELAENLCVKFSLKRIVIQHKTSIKASNF